MAAPRNSGLKIVLNELATSGVIRKGHSSHVFGNGPPSVWQLDGGIRKMAKSLASIVEKNEKLEEKVVVLQKEMKELKGYAQVERRAKKSYLPDPATDETLQFVEELNLRRKSLCDETLQIVEDLRTKDLRKKRQSFYDYANCGNYGNGNL